MKTNLTKLITLCLMLFMSYGAFAQNQTKNVGESYTYTVSTDVGPGTNTFTWSISGTENTDWKVIEGALNTASVKILWLKPNDYTVSFTQEQEHTVGGIVCSTSESGTVRVGNNFDATIADATSVCGGTTGNTDFTFVVSKTGGNANWSFHYKTDGLTAEVEGDQNVSGKDSFDLLIPVANVTDGTDKTFNVVLSLIKDSAGNEDTDNTNNETATVTLYGVPDTGAINW